MTRKESIAWAAGLYEGEGWAFHRPQANGQGRLPKVNVGLASTDLDVLRRFESVVMAGAVSQIRCITGTKPLYRWQTGRWPEAVAVLSLLRPFMGERRAERADEILAVWEERKHLYQHRNYRRATSI